MSKRIFISSFSIRSRPICEGIFERAALDSAQISRPSRTTANRAQSAQKGMVFMANSDPNVEEQVTLLIGILTGVKIIFMEIGSVEGNIDLASFNQIRMSTCSGPNWSK